MEHFTAIIIGVVSGIITSIIIWFFYQFLIKVFMPWLESLLYKGIIIDGSWKSRVDLPRLKVELHILVKQKGHKIKGEMLANYLLPKEKTVRLKFEGFIIDNHINLRYKADSRNISSLGTYLLKICNGGERLTGGMLAVDKLSGNIETYNDLTWERISG